MPHLLALECMLVACAGSAACGGQRAGCWQARGAEDDAPQRHVPNHQKEHACSEGIWGALQLLLAPSHVAGEGAFCSICGMLAKQAMHRSAYSPASNAATSGALCTFQATPAVPPGISPTHLRWPALLMHKPFCGPRHLRAGHQTRLRGVGVDQTVTCLNALCKMNKYRQGIPGRFSGSSTPRHMHGAAVWTVHARWLPTGSC